MTIKLDIGWLCHEAFLALLNAKRYEIGSSGAKSDSHSMIQSFVWRAELANTLYPPFRLAR